MKKIKKLQKTLSIILSVIMVLACLPLTGGTETTQMGNVNLTNTYTSAEEPIQNEIPITPESTDVYISEEPEPTSIYTEDILMDDIEGNGNTVSTLSSNAFSNTALTVRSYAGPPSEDTYIYYSNSSTVYGSSTKLWVSSSRITYLKYDLSFLPEGAVITNAYISVPYYYNVTSGYLYVGAYEVEEPWSESTLTWNNASSSSNISTTRIGDEQKAIARSGMSESSHDFMTFNITELANKWVYSGENNGLALKYSNSADNLDDDLNSSVILLSRENSNGYGASIFIQYVVLEDGVYSFKNVGNEDRYMDIQQNKTSPGYHVQQYNFTTAPESNFSRSGLYKISRDPETGMFIIRLMLNNKLSFGISGSEVLTKQINFDDNYVSQSDMFTIEFAGDGYRIKPYNSSLVVSTKSAFPEASGASGGENSYLTALSETVAGDNGLWIPTKYTGEDKYGLTRSVSGDFIAGEQVTVTAVSWSTVPGVNRQNIYVHSDYLDVATSTINTTTTIMTMNIHNEGAIRVIYDFCYDGSSVPVKSFQDTWNSELPFDEGTYFFENVEEGLYMQIDDDDSSNNYSTNFAKLELKNATKKDYQKWKVIHVSDGYYKILSIKSGLVVSVQSSYLDKEEYLVQETYSGLPRQLWNFEYDTEVEAYIVRPQSAINDDIDWCMCGENSFFFSSELDVLQSDHIDNNSYLDYWQLTPSNEYLHMFIGDEEGDFLMTNFMESVDQAFREDALMSGYAYDFCEYLPEYEFNKAKVLELLSEISIFTCITHGETDRIWLLDNEVLTISDVEQIPESNIEDLRFVYLGACLTGNGCEDADNLVNAFADKGVDFVLGFTVEIIRGEANKWTDYFLARIANGETIAAAMQGADEDLYNDKSYGRRDSYTTEQRHHRGNINVVICPQY